MKKQLTDLARVVYHGTISVYEESLRAGIDLDRGIQTTDFGKGFYTTTIRSQAEKFAARKAVAYNKQHRSGAQAQPLVIAYELNTEILSRCSGIIFSEPDTRWKEFIFNNRVGEDFIISDFHNLNTTCDYVYGAVADANIVTLTKGVRESKTDFSSYCRDVIPLHNGTADQLSFHSDRSLKAIELLEIIRKEAAAL